MTVHITMKREKPAPTPIPTPTLNLWTLKGDEELPEHNFKSRTADPKWQWPYPCTPSVYRFDKQPTEPKNDYRVDISPLDSAIRAINENNDWKVRYLYADDTALFNSTGYPKQAYITMSGNQFLELGIVGTFLKFATLTPNSNVSGFTHQNAPWFVHRFDIVCYTKTKITYHTSEINAKHRDVDYFLVTNEGFGYIPLYKVKKRERE